MLKYMFSEVYHMSLLGGKLWDLLARSGFHQSSPNSNDAEKRRSPKNR